MAVDDEMDDGNMDDSHVNDGDADDDRAEDDKAGEDKANDNKAAKPRSERHMRNQARLNRNSHRRRDEKKAEKKAKAAQDGQLLASNTTHHQGKQILLHGDVDGSTARPVGTMTDLRFVGGMPRSRCFPTVRRNFPTNMLTLLLDSTQEPTQPTERPPKDDLGPTIAPDTKETSSDPSAQPRAHSRKHIESPANSDNGGSLASVSRGATVDKTKKRKRLPDDIGCEHDAKLARQMEQIALNSTTNSRGTQTEQTALGATTNSRGTQTVGVGLSIRTGKPPSFTD